jgi:hypothetical protein
MLYYQKLGLRDVSATAAVEAAILDQLIVLKYSLQMSLLKSWEETGKVD